jgi:coatomer subunit beta'
VFCVVEKGQNNLAFAALLQLGDPEKCVDLLIKTGRASEAALFARTYAPRYLSSCFLPFLPSLTPSLDSKISTALKAWQTSLQTGSSSSRGKLVASIADPEKNPEVFEEGWEESLKREKSVNGGEGVSGEAEEEEEESEEESDDDDDEDDEEEE